MGMTEAEVTRLVGPVGPLVMYEILRTGASSGELRRAAAVAGSVHGPQTRLSPRMRRLVDLLGAVGHGLEAGTAA